MPAGLVLLVDINVSMSAYQCFVYISLYRIILTRSDGLGIRFFQCYFPSVETVFSLSFKGTWVVDLIGLNVSHVSIFVHV